MLGGQVSCDASGADARHGRPNGKRWGLSALARLPGGVRRANAFNMNCCAVAPLPQTNTDAGLDRLGAELPRLLRESDYIALTCDLNAETKGIDADAFALMKPTAIREFSRGEVVPCSAGTRIDGAALVAWYRYPATVENVSRLDRGGPFQGSQYDFNELDNVLLTPQFSPHDADEALCVIAKGLREYARRPQSALWLPVRGENLDDFKMP